MRNFFTQTTNLMLQVDSSQQFANSFGTHAGIEVITELFERFEVLLIIQQLTLFKGGHAWIDNHVAFEIQHAFDITQGHVQQQTDTATAAISGTRCAQPARPVRCAPCAHDEL